MGTREERIRALLRVNQGMTDNYEWPWLGESRQLSAKDANKFLLGACIDYQISADKAWDSARILTETIMRDPHDLWNVIRKMGLQRLKDEFGGVCRPKECNRCAAGHQLIKPKDSNSTRHGTLHRFKNQAAEKVWKTTHAVLERHGGDARKIWKGRQPADVLDRLAAVGLGPNMSNMVVGALLDTEQINGESKLKADLNVCRVLGRVFAGEKVTPDEAHRIAETVEPGGTWNIDGVLYALGRETCTAKEPDCQGCFLKAECEYYNRNTTEERARHNKHHMYP